MANWTTTSKQRLSWEAPIIEAVTGVAYQLDIGSGFLLDIGSGYNLTIQPENTETQWTNTDKSNGHSWPATNATGVDYFLDIGGYNLLIDDTNKLIVDPARSETPWTLPHTKSKAMF